VRPGKETQADKPNLAYRPFSWPRRRPAVFFLVLASIVLLLAVAGTATYWTWKMIDRELHIEELDDRR
jgi:hypothetical protein